MSEGEQATTRRRAGRAARGAALPQPLGRIVNPWKPVEIFTQEQVVRLIDAAHTVLETMGMEILSRKALALYRQHGAVVDDERNLVKLPRDVVEHYRRLAPAQFTLKARNAARSLQLGGNVLNFGPVGGAPNVSDLDRGRRYGDIAAFRDIIRLNHVLGVLHWQGGIVCEPVDVPVPVRHLQMNLAHILNSDLVWQPRGLGGRQIEDALAMSALEHGVSIEDLVHEPTMLLITNVNSPRRVDEDILDGIMTMAAHGQCVCITPFTLMGAMAPITLAGALVQQTAEALAIVVLTQMIRPGAPCVMGGFTSNVDMRTGSPAFGTPENVHATLGGAQLARALNLPFRSSAVTASPCVDAQSTYETGFSLWAAIMSHSSMITHAAGWIEDGLVNSFEKTVVDAEMLRSWAEMLKPAEFSDDDLGLEAIGGVAPGGHFFGSAHTLARYEKAFYRPFLSDWSNFESWSEAGSLNATQRAHKLWQQALASFEPPALDIERKEAIEAFVARREREILT